jgi:excinuclease ABC subunit B
MPQFKVKAPFAPSGSQPEAIKQLVEQRPGNSTLLGVTGSGKTFTIANVIEQHQRPTLILSPNKTLAAQLYEEFSLFFPENKVCYFVSYYDYYQPESYLPSQDIYIPKETKINAEIERLRVESTASLVNRPDTIVITSVSCIYGLGNPYDYRELAFKLKVGDTISRGDLLRQLIFIQYTRNDVERGPGTFMVVGNIIEVTLPYQKERLRIELFGSTVDRITLVDRQQHTELAELDNTLIFPAKHFVTTEDKKNRAVESILTELDQWLPQLKNPVYQDRLARRVQHDVEMIKEVGYCSGIENYSAHFDGRKPGEAPYCLFDFYEKDFLMVIDESHIALPQLRGMYAGDRSRKQALIDFGFRLPSAFDNRPLKFEETEKYFTNTIFVSATPGEYELNHSQKVVEQIIRPTGLVDPLIEIKPRENQIDVLLEQIKSTIDKDYRCLITVLTKKMAEELAEFLEKKKIKVCYLHSDIKTPDRTALLQKLRLGIFDVLVGVNLLREGLDLPEVALVAIMDADVESFLRDRRSLIQIIGRAARNNDARVLMFADRITRSMQDAIDETNRRRAIQEAYNTKHKVVPTSVKREVIKSITPLAQLKEQVKKKRTKAASIGVPQEAIIKRIVELEALMQKAADEFKFEDAIRYRDEWHELNQQLGQPDKK